MMNLLAAMHTLCSLSTVQHHLHTPPTQHCNTHSHQDSSEVVFFQSSFYLLPYGGSALDVVYDVRDGLQSLFPVLC